MNKKEFLSILEKRLSILNDDERKDIINEYKDTISEKVKNGQTEEEAIKDFGNIDDLVKELLSAYKINPNFENKEKSSLDNILDESETLVKKGANKLAEFTKNLYHRFEASNKEINLSLMFEILIKIFLLVLVLAFLRLPFILFEELGEQIFEAFFSPIDNVLSFVWQVCLMILYLVFCILISIAIFKKYFTSEGIIKEKTEKDLKEKSKDETVSSKPSEKEKRDINDDHTTIGDICLLIIKLFVVLFVIVPLAFLDAFALFGLIVSVFYFIKGINLLGLSILLLGAGVLITYLIKLLFNLVFSKKTITFIPAVIGIILVTVGSIMFFDMVMNINYIDASSDTKNMDVKEEVYTIDKDTIASLHYYCNGTKTVDDMMADNQVKVKVTYDKSYYDVAINFDNNHRYGYCEDDEHNGESCSHTTYNYISIDLVDNGFDNLKKDYDRFIDNLKDNKIYDYDNEEILVEIIANEKTLNRIKYE